MSENQKKSPGSRVLSPDNLSHTLQVASPGILFSILTILIIAVGFFVWAAFGTIQKTLEVNLIYENNYIDTFARKGIVLSEEEIKKLELVFESEDISDSSSLIRCICFVTDDEAEEIETGMKVKTSKWHGFVLSESSTPVRFHDTMRYPVFISCPTDQDSMEVKAQIILEEITPISFLIS